MKSITVKMTTPNCDLTQLREQQVFPGQCKCLCIPCVRFYMATHIQIENIRRAPYTYIRDHTFEVFREFRENG